MVYSVRSDRPIVSRRPLQTKMSQTEHSKKVNAFMRTHRVSVRIGSSGDAVIKVAKK